MQREEMACGRASTARRRRDRIYREPGLARRGEHRRCIQWGRRARVRPVQDRVALEDGPVGTQAPSRRVPSTPHNFVHAACAIRGVGLTAWHPCEIVARTVARATRIVIAFWGAVRVLELISVERKAWPNGEGTSDGRRWRRGRTKENLCGGEDFMFFCHFRAPCTNTYSAGCK